MALRHHELCFGCGRTNLFGVMAEVEEAGEGRVTGRCFIKQDHQGALRGTAHEGVVTAALSEAMALCLGPDARLRRIEVEILAPVPVGTFLEMEAQAGPALEIEAQAPPVPEIKDAISARSRALLENEVVARASATFER